MKDILETVDVWISEGEQVALATVVHTWGSSPRRIGSKMAITPGGMIAGSVSGGCVEGAVFEAGVEVLKTGIPRLLKFGVADEAAWEVGLACGGRIEVFVQPLRAELFAQWRKEILTNRPYSVVTITSGPAELLGQTRIFSGQERAESKDRLEGLLFESAIRAMAAGESQRFVLDWFTSPLQVFVEVIKEPLTLVIVGGVHIAIALTSLAKTIGYSTVVIDPRRAFGNRERFPHVDRLIQAWPDEAFPQVGISNRTAIAMLTHDPKIDDPALKIALNSPAFYIGALGSWKTQIARRKRLLRDGLTEEQLDRLHGPIGLDLGGETPEEIALAIMAEIVAADHRRALGGTVGRGQADQNSLKRRQPTQTAASTALS